MDEWLFLWGLVYLCIDILYVYCSQPIYGKYLPKNDKTIQKITSALLTYILMYFGFIFIMIPFALTFAFSKKWINGAVGGGLYGLIIYGIFNGTVGVMLDTWTWPIMLIDITWGILSHAFIGALYYMFN